MPRTENESRSLTALGVDGAQFSYGEVSAKCRFYRIARLSSGVSIIPKPGDDKEVEVLGWFADEMNYDYDDMTGRLLCKNGGEDVVVNRLQKQGCVDSTSDSKE